MSLKEIQVKLVGMNVFHAPRVYFPVCMPVKMDASNWRICARCKKKKSYALSGEFQLVQWETWGVLELFSQTSVLHLGWIMFFQIYFTSENMNRSSKMNSFNQLTDKREASTSGRYYFKWPVNDTGLTSLATRREAWLTGEVWNGFSQHICRSWQKRISALHI